MFYKFIRAQRDLMLDNVLAYATWPFHLTGYVRGLVRSISIARTYGPQIARLLEGCIGSGRKPVSLVMLERRFKRDTWEACQFVQR